MSLHQKGLLNSPVYKNQILQVQVEQPSSLVRLLAFAYIAFCPDKYSIVLGKVNMLVCCTLLLFTQYRCQLKDYKLSRCPLSFLPQDLEPSPNGSPSKIRLFFLNLYPCTAPVAYVLIFATYRFGAALYNFCLYSSSQLITIRQLHPVGAFFSLHLSLSVTSRPMPV